MARRSLRRPGSGCPAPERIRVSNSLTQPLRFLRILARIKKRTLLLTNPGVRHRLATGRLMPELSSKKSGFICRLLPSRLVRRFVRQQDGSAAVEFGMVAVPFLGLTFAIFETALVFFAGQTLETAVADLARLIMTGQAQTGDGAGTTSRTRLSHIYGPVRLRRHVRRREDLYLVLRRSPMTHASRPTANLIPAKSHLSAPATSAISKSSRSTIVAHLRFAARQSSVEHTATTAFWWRQRSSETNPINEACA